MAWAVIRPSGYGNYFPDGGQGRSMRPFVGWDEMCEEYYLSVTPKEEVEELKSRGETAYIRWAITIPRSEAAETLAYDRGPAKPHQMPPEYRAVKTYTNLASWIFLGGYPVVCEPFKELIEEFEPGVHQFWPMKITMPKGKEYPEKYFGMNVLQWLDTFLPDESEYRTANKNMTQFWAGDTKKELSKLSFSRDAIGGAHLWREKRLISPYYYISDAMQAEIATRGFTMFRHYPVKEV